MDEVSFDGEYELTEPESLSEDESENDVEDRRNYRNRNTKKPKKVAKQVDRPHIVMNVSGTTNIHH